jgi:tetratricopeptide (TPR) repeat protein
MADMALYQGRAADAAAILEKGAAADLEGGRAGSASIKLAALASALPDRARAAQAAERALAAGKQESAALPAARVLLETGREARALAVAAELAMRLAPESQAYAKLIEGEAQLARGKGREAIDSFQAARKLLDTWQGRLDLARAYIRTANYAEAAAELEECIRRKGEATAVFFDDAPSFRYFPQAYYYLGQAQEGLKSPGAAESYKTFLEIKAKADDGEPMVADARKRLAALR